MAGVLKQFTIVQADEAEAIKNAASRAEWFELIMDGRMLLMPQRPTLTKPMQKAADVASMRLRTKSAEERGFYVWMESKNVPLDQFPTDEQVDTTNAEPADYDPLNDVI